VIDHVEGNPYVIEKIAACSPCASAAMSSAWRGGGDQAAGTTKAC